MSKILTSSKAREYHTIRQALMKLPRDDMRAMNKKLGIKTGHQKVNTVNNLANYLVG